MVLWSLEKNIKFSVRSMYNALTRSDAGIYHKMLWKGKIPTKIKIFMWLLMNDAILTKDNLLKRKWQGDPTCYFCDEPESISHLFFHCHVAKSVWAIVAKCFGADTVPGNLDQSWRWCDRWLPLGRKYHVLGVSAICKSRNKACFDKIIIKSPLDIICHMCALMKYWAGLFAEPNKEQLIEGINTMLRLANRILKRQREEQDDAGRILGGDQDGQDDTPA